MKEEESSDKNGNRQMGETIDRWLGDRHHNTTGTGSNSLTPPNIYRRRTTTTNNSYLGLFPLLILVIGPLVPVRHKRRVVSEELL